MLLFDEYKVKLNIMVKGLGADHLIALEGPAR